MVQQYKEEKFSNKNKLLSTKIVSKENNIITDEKILFQDDNFPDLPFNYVDHNPTNGFNTDVRFEDAEFIDGQYIVIREKTNPYSYDNQYSTIHNKTYFNKKKQIIKIEENGIYETFVQTFKYDEDGYLIEEKIDRDSHLFQYRKKIYGYEERYSGNLKKSEKYLKYSSEDSGREEFFSYNENGDLLVRTLKFLGPDGDLELYEDQYVYKYAENGLWTERKHFLNGNLKATHTREYGDFSFCFKVEEENEDYDDLPF